LYNGQFIRTFSKENKEDTEKEASEDKKANTPSGFEKFLKKTRKGSDHNKPATEPTNGNGNEEKPEGSKDNKSDKKDAKKLKDEEDKEEDLTDEEFEKDDKKDKKKEDEFDYIKGSKNIFVDPNSGKPKWDNIGLTAFLAAVFGYILATREEASKEITYIEFVNQYLI